MDRTPNDIHGRIVQDLVFLVATKEKVPATEITQIAREGAPKARVWQERSSAGISGDVYIDIHVPEGKRAALDNLVDQITKLSSAFGQKYIPYTAVEVGNENVSTQPPQIPGQYSVTLRFDSNIVGPLLHEVKALRNSQKAFVELDVATGTGQCAAVNKVPNGPALPSVRGTCR